MSLYKLVTTENVDLNYKAFKKDELIYCILNLNTQVSLKLMTGLCLQILKIDKLIPQEGCAQG